VVGQEAIIGYGDDFTPNEARPELLDWGVNLVGKGVKSLLVLLYTVIVL